MDTMTSETQPSDRAVTEPRRMLIDGKLVPSVSGRTFESRNPATGAIVGTLYEGDEADINLAVAAARRAFTGPWSKFTPFERQACLLRFSELVDTHFEELAMTDVLDMGVPITVSLGRRARVLGLLRFYAGACTAIQGATPAHSLPGDVFAYTLKEPIGVVGAITPWNGPLVHTMWKIGPVLATGCTLVLKPAEDASLTALRLGELLLEAGVPEGVINVVSGFGHTAGAALATHMDVDKISFTGSDATGRRILDAAKGNIKRVTLELGGKSPDVVFADCDIDAAVPGAAMGVFANTGQSCTAGTRLLIERPILDEFVDRMARFAKTIRVGDSVEAETQLGPIINAKQLDRVSRYIDIGATEGAKLVTGGKRLTDGALADGFFIEPTILSNVTNDMQIAQDEIFGPVVCVIPFDSIEEATALANATPFGLGSGVWTQSLKTAHRMARSIRAGTVWVNNYGPLDPAVPFGGYKTSGLGREGGMQQMDEYLETKAVIMKFG